MCFQKLPHDAIRNAVCDCFPNRFFERHATLLVLVDAMDEEAIVP